MKSKHENITSREQSFVQRPATRIWEERPSEDNPYIAAEVRCHGYDLFELMGKRSFVDVLFLLFRGDLPTTDQSRMLEKLMIGLINPGPRHPATRAAMHAGVGKTNPAHILPIALSILGGTHLGAGCVEDAMRFFRQAAKRDPRLVCREAIQEQQRPAQGDWHPVPGFGSRFGSVDEVPGKLATELSRLPGAGKALRWGCSFAEALREHGIGWLFPGVAAAVLADMGFQPRAGAGLFQYFQAPGLLAHGLEMVNKPLTALPFPSDANYVIEGDADAC
ncbi:citrate/2-methylcitrate synthase [Geoalkalibacter sp.]|uniref:citrate/2-methylcitrate synthase n=1 Tax=Geoalkalibacter sp. TaxID=3041440 RepID=UPI00272DD3D2|nr:citrate/2-methylcitrate synthase [Geoalkalibacter sp.]